MGRDKTRDRGSSRMMMGVLIISLGVLFLLQNLGVLYVEDIWQFWPVFLIVVGISKMFNCYTASARLWGGMIAAIGGVFLLNNLGYIHANVWHMFWPVILIFAGLSMLLRGFEGGRFGWGGPVSASGPVSGDSLSEWAIFGGTRRQVDSQDFQGGSVEAVFGGVEIDLRKASITRSEIILEANAMFGGIEITVPETWRVTVQGTGIFGGYADKTFHSLPGTGLNRPHLIVSGHALFGGVNIQN